MNLVKVRHGLKLFLLLLCCYFLGLLAVVVFYHHNQNLDVVINRWGQYLIDTWLPCLLATLFVSVCFSIYLKYKSSPMPKWVSVVVVQSVVYMTALLFFLKMSLLQGGQWPEVSVVLDLIAYSSEQSFLGLVYCLPVSIPASMLFKTWLDHNEQL